MSKCIRRSDGDLRLCEGASEAIHPYRISPYPHDIKAGEVVTFYGNEINYCPYCGVDIRYTPIIRKGIHLTLVAEREQNKDTVEVKLMDGSRILSKVTILKGAYSIKDVNIRHIISQYNALIEDVFRSKGGIKL